MFSHVYHYKKKKTGGFPLRHFNSRSAPDYLRGKDTDCLIAFEFGLCA